MKWNHSWTIFHGWNQKVDDNFLDQFYFILKYHEISSTKVMNQTSSIHPCELLIFLGCSFTKSRWVSMDDVNWINDSNDGIKLYIVLHRWYLFYSETTRNFIQMKFHSLWDISAGWAILHLSNNQVIAFEHNPYMD
jgi:hypothetical protein